MCRNTRYERRNEDQVLMAVNIKITDIWDISPCRFLDRYQCCRGTHCLPLQGRSKHYTQDRYMRLEVMMKTIKITFWDVMPYSGAPANCLLCLLLDPEDGGCTFLQNISELNWITWHHTPEDSIHHIQSCKSLKSNPWTMIIP
jgi:hypothetical protein